MTERPPFWRPFARRQWREQQLRSAAIRWQRDCWEWSRRHPGKPLMEAVITRTGSAVRWNGPAPDQPTSDTPRVVVNDPDSGVRGTGPTHRKAMEDFQRALREHRDALEQDPEYRSEWAP